MKECAMFALLERAVKSKDRKCAIAMDTETCDGECADRRHLSTVVEVQGKSDPLNSSCTSRTKSGIYPAPQGSGCLQSSTSLRRVLGASHLVHHFAQELTPPASGSGSAIASMPANSKTGSREPGGSSARTSDSTSIRASEEDTNV